MSSPAPVDHAATADVQQGCVHVRPVPNEEAGHVIVESTLSTYPLGMVEHGHRATRVQQHSNDSAVATDQEVETTGDQEASQEDSTSTTDAPAAA